MTQEQELITQPTQEQQTRTCSSIHQELIDRITRQEELSLKLEEKIRRLEESKPTEENKTTQEPTKPKTTKKPTPAAPIDLEGNPEAETTREQVQPLDLVNVKIPRRRWEDRPVMTESMTEKVTEELEKHVEEKYRGPDPPKTKPQKEMEPGQRTNIIQSMLAKSALHVGIGPLTKDHIARVGCLLQTKGLFSPEDTKMEKQQRTVKSHVKSWCRKNLKMEDKDWDTIELVNIITAENSDIVFLYCKTNEDATKLTSRAKHLPRDMGPETPRIVMYIDRRAMKRHKAILNIAKTLREHSKNSVQTNIRTGKNDYLLRKRNKGDDTPWSEIPPMILAQKIPEFEVGRYKDMINPDNNGER